MDIFSVNRRFWVKRTTFLTGTAVIVAVGVSLYRDTESARVGAVPADAMMAAWVFQGNASCAGSGCHGESEATEQSGQMIGDESNIWSESDPHTNAYASLKDDLSNEIAGKLKIADATASARCLDCHAINAPEDKRGELFSLSDAVGCESCHGPAEKWLDPHAEEGWTAEQRQAHGHAGLWKQFGLNDTANLALRAETCVACHLQMDKDMIDAGHPPLEFEMYAYNYYISKDPDAEFAIHWDEPIGEMRDAQLWAVGQAAALGAAKAQAVDWKKKGWDLDAAEALVKLYQDGVGIASKHFGGDTAEALAKATYKPESCAGAAKALAALAGGAADPIQRRVIASGVAALGSAIFDGREEEAPEEFWDTFYTAIDPETGADDYAAAVKALAEMIE